MWKCCPAHLLKLCLQTDVFPRKPSMVLEGMEGPWRYFLPDTTVCPPTDMRWMWLIYMQTHVCTYTYENSISTRYENISLLGCIIPLCGWLLPNCCPGLLCSVCQEHFRDGQLRGLPCWPAFQSKSPLDSAESNSARPFHGMIMKGL